jgi:hypothetical protein
VCVTEQTPLRLLPTLPRITSQPAQELSMDMHTHEHGHPDLSAVHNMAVVGEHAIFLSHLPMFMPPHDAQVLLQASFFKDGKNVDALYAADRVTNRTVRFYTLQPETFAIRELFQAEAPKPLRQRFRATVFRGHLEKGGVAIDLLKNIEVRITRVVHAHSFAGNGRTTALTYALFGSPNELYLAHLISQAPDFDQIVSVTATGALPTADELQHGVTVEIPGRTNSAAARLKVKDVVAGKAHATGAHQFLDLMITVQAEQYFEEGELSASKMTGAMFAQTPEEKKAGFE